METCQQNTLENASPLNRNINTSDGINVAAVTLRDTIADNDQKIVAIRNVLEKDLPAADFRWSLFVAACQNYRFDSCLRPFPPQFLIGENKDINTLLEVVDRTPTFTLLLQHLRSPDTHKINEQTVDLLYWVLIRLKDTRLKTLPKEKHDAVLKKVSCEVAAQPPNIIFQIVNAPRSTSDDKWLGLVRGHKTMFAFHGSRLINYHSILHVGLQQHMNKNSLFGRGIYLSSELSVSLPFSPTGYGWGKSLFGSELSCVALCEMINHPDVKCQDKDPTRSVTSDSMGGDVPKKYFVVINSDLVRLRYLLVYSRKDPSIISANRETVFGWFGKHKFLTFVVGYLVLLVSIGLSNSQHAQRCCKLFWKWLGS